MAQRNQRPDQQHQGQRRRDYRYPELFHRVSPKYSTENILVIYSGIRHCGFPLVGNAWCIGVVATRCAGSKRTTSHRDATWDKLPSRERFNALEVWARMVCVSLTASRAVCPGQVAESPRARPASGPCTLTTERIASRRPWSRRPSNQLRATKLI